MLLELWRLSFTVDNFENMKNMKMRSQVPQPSHKLMAVKFPRQVYITEQFHSSSDSSLICAWTVTTPFGPAVKSWREETKRGWWGWHDCPVELSKLYETGWLKTTLVLIWKKDQEQLTMLSRCLRLPAFPTSSQPGQMVVSKQMGIQLVYREVSFLEEVLILQTMGFCGHPFFGQTRDDWMTGWPIPGTSWKRALQVLSSSCAASTAWPRRLGYGWIVIKMLMLCQLCQLC